MSTWVTIVTRTIVARCPWPAARLPSPRARRRLEEPEGTDV